MTQTLTSSNNYLSVLNAMERFFFEEKKNHRLQLRKLMEAQIVLDLGRAHEW